MDNTAENFYKTGNIPEENFGLNGLEEGTDGIALLVTMAKTGKIDPWNIDIVDITDKYLVQMAEKKANNLRNTGRTIWLASVLLKLKSNVLVGLDPMDFDSVMAQNNFEDYDDGFEPDYNPQPVRKTNVVSIDEALKRRLSTRLNRKRTVTLQDLIKQLKFYEELDKKQALKNSLNRAKERARNFDNISAKEFVKQAADNESIKITINALTKKLEKIFVKCEKVELNDLVDIGMEKVSAYMALLFLTAENKVSLHQEEIYGDLYVQKAGMETVAEDTSATDTEEEQPVDKDIYFKDTTIGGMSGNIIKTPPIKEAVAAS
ncbi:MAG: segregation/condensation protein A [Candidatus Gastranaerophilales bacterium]|nr:segregation/condensation protein A [Candidatus Gastranaerophilales bacterium]